MLTLKINLSGTVPDFFQTTSTQGMKIRNLAGPRYSDAVATATKPILHSDLCPYTEAGRKKVDDGTSSLPVVLVDNQGLGAILILCQ